MPHRADLLACFLGFQPVEILWFRLFPFIQFTIQQIFLSQTVSTACLLFFVLFLAALDFEAFCTLINTEEAVGSPPVSGYS